MHCPECQTVNAYLAHKQHLLPAARLGDVVQVAQDLVGLHATDPTTPYLSLWARGPGFRREALEVALYERRALVKVLCMRTTLHVVPSAALLHLFPAYADRHITATREQDEALLVLAGLCQEGQASEFLDEIHRRVLAVLAEEGPSTVRSLSQALPALSARVRHSAGRSYEGTFSVGSRLVPGMCTLGLLVRAQPQGTWRSNLHAYAPLSDWLPGVDLEAVPADEARAWLVRRYLEAYGPTTVDDVGWWTGFSAAETESALQVLAPTLVEVTVEGTDVPSLMLAEDAQRLEGYIPPDTPYAFLLPGLDPYVMGYRDRRRTLDPAHHEKVFDRAGNAMPTAWAGGRVVGCWAQRVDGRVVLGLFETVDEEARALLEDEARRLEAFLEGEILRPRTQTRFLRALQD